MHAWSMEWLVYTIHRTNGCARGGPLLFILRVLGLTCPLSCRNPSPKVPPQTYSSASDATQMISRPASPSDGATSTNVHHLTLSLPPAGSFLRRFNVPLNQFSYHLIDLLENIADVLVLPLADHSYPERWLWRHSTCKASRLTQSELCKSTPERWDQRPCCARDTVRLISTSHVWGKRSHCRLASAVRTRRVARMVVIFVRPLW